MEVTAADGNVTLAMLSHLVSQARRVRLGSWCVRVVVVSHDPAFLVAFAEFSLKGRLLVWATRLVVVTRLTLPQLYALLPAHWTFSMMNTIFLNLEDTATSLRYRLYTHLPYSPDGAQVVRVAAWSLIHGIVQLAGLTLFPEKFTSFYGAAVKVAAKSWPPYWDEVEVKAPNGSVYMRYSGSDYQTLIALSEALNFSFSFFPIATWMEAAERVKERKVLFTAVNHFILPRRLNRHDFTYAYEFLRMSFSMVKPAIKPRWQSLYYPLTDQVWVAMLVVLLFMPTFLYTIYARGSDRGVGKQNRMTVGAVALEVTGILVGQNLPLRLPDIGSSRVLLTVWLVFSFVVGTAYRGNLTAALTLPKFPLRPETVQELVQTIDRVTAPPIGRDWQKFMLSSESEAYRKLAGLMLIGPTIQEGLLMATKMNTAQMTDRRNMAFTIAKYFTRADGSTQLYLGREPILPIPSAMPIPHDAPYTPQLNRCLMAIVETGLLKKWEEDTIRDVRRESERKQQELLAKKQQQQQEGVEDTTESGGGITALTLTHMQGPIMLLTLGLATSGIIFLGEILVMRYW
ncbi:ionotropic receptor 21a-like [Panulirus ornatus]|uniref:ionotropic receptor 21a-like n=1 Tax=Panulirus ornatus TaxID=150431 RepID=UPI003A8A9FBD